MGKIKSIEELRKLREYAKESLKVRAGEAKVKIIISMSTVGIAAGSRDALISIMDELEERKFYDVQVVERGSLGLDTEEPVVGVERDGKTIYYGKVTPEFARRIVVEHVINGQIISEKVIARGK